MRVITVQRLDGIPRDSAAALYDAMKGCTNGQRLAVALYLMSDLADRMHGLSRIEENLRRIFPKSLRHGKLPDDYKDFAAATVRALFNLETMAVKHGELAEAHRLWSWRQRGCWRNTVLGNQYALQVLRKREILIQYREQVQNPSIQILPEAKRPYMEEDLAEPLPPSKEEQAIEQPEGESLLAYIDRVLEGLPDLVIASGEAVSSAAVELRGTRDEVRALMSQIADMHAPSEATLTLTISRGGGLQVCVRTTP